MTSAATSPFGIPTTSKHLLKGTMRPRASHYTDRSHYTFNAHFTPKPDIAKTGVFAKGEVVCDTIVRLSTRFGAGGLGLKFHRDGKTLHDLLFLTTTTIPNDAVKLVILRRRTKSTVGPTHSAALLHHQCIWLGKQTSRQICLQPAAGQTAKSI